jgi:hypothetical protein
MVIHHSDVANRKDMKPKMAKRGKGALKSNKRFYIERKRKLIS